jgi:hypothetical protein
MSTRATDLPEVRAQLIDHYSDPHVVDWWAQHPTPRRLSCVAQTAVNYS